MTDDVPRLAVIIPNYNYERYVGLAIASVLSQRRPDVEVVVVDDGSTDGSWSVIEASGVAKRIRGANGGQVSAVVRGLDATEAPFVMVLDADDELEPGSLDRIIPLLDGDVAKLQFQMTPVDADGAPIGPPSPDLPDSRRREEVAREVVATGSYTTPPTSGNVFRRDVISIAREVDYEKAVDGAALFVAPFLGDIVTVGAPLGRYRVHDKNQSQRGNQPNAARFKLEADRFVTRLEHVTRFLSARGVAVPDIDATRMPFYRERRIYEGVMRGERPSPRTVAGLGASMLRQPIPLKRRVGIVMVAALCGALPAGRAQEMLAYRMGTGERSLGGLVRRLAGRMG